MDSNCKLAYLGLAVNDLDAWDKLLTGVLGMMRSDASDEGPRAYRMDEADRRILLYRDPADDLAFMGWEAAGPDAFDDTVARLSDAGIKVKPGSDAEARERGVERFVRFADPLGTPLELCLNPRRAAQPFRSPLVGEGFVTGDEGMGHVLMAVPELAAQESFYRDVMGLKLTDYVKTEVDGHPLSATFLHGNPRHHSLALAEVPMPKRLHHFMVEVRELDEVGRAFDRCQDASVPIVLGIGRHENDQMISFYGATPSGFAFEFGWGARKVDDRTWKPTVWGRVSEWGHRPPPNAPAFVPND